MSNINPSKIGDTVNSDYQRPSFPPYPPPISMQHMYPQIPYPPPPPPSVMSYPTQPYPPPQSVMSYPMPPYPPPPSVMSYPKQPYPQPQSVMPYPTPPYPPPQTVMAYSMPPLSAYLHYHIKQQQCGEQGPPSKSAKINMAHATTNINMVHTDLMVSKATTAHTATTAHNTHKTRKVPAGFKIDTRPTPPCIFAETKNGCTNKSCSRFLHPNQPGYKESKVYYSNVQCKNPYCETRPFPTCSYKHDYSEASSETPEQTHDVEDNHKSENSILKISNKLLQGANTQLREANAKFEGANTNLQDELTAVRSQLVSHQARIQELSAEVAGKREQQVPT